MFEWLFGKKEVKKLRNELKNSFEAVKKDISKTGNWITHLHERGIKTDSEINFIKKELSSVKEELEELKDFISIFGRRMSRQVSKKSGQVSNNWTGVEGVQTAVQTAVQGPNFDDFFNFSIVERAIIWVLLNSDLKLSYEDIALMLGKERSTIRTHVNSIKQKSEGLISEIIEKNGKKRIFIPEKIRERLLKSAKVRLKFKKKKDGFNEKNEIKREKIKILKNEGKKHKKVSKKK